MGPEVGIKVVLPIRTLPEGNVREHWHAVAKRKAEHREVAKMVIGQALKARALRGLDFVPAIVTLTRVSAGKLDKHDNLRSALKFTVDGVAAALGVDDGDEERVEWRYQQRKGTAGKYAVEILIEKGSVTRG